MRSPLGSVGSAIPRIAGYVVNGLEVLAMGGLQVDEQPAPFEVVAEDRYHRLRHYFPGPGDTGPETAVQPAVVLVPPLMLSAEVYDVSEGTSAVSILHGLGVDPWVVDFGSPEEVEGGMERTMSDHILAVDRAVTQVSKSTGRPVHLLGYSQGGMFCYQVAAYRRGSDISSLVTLGSTVDVWATEGIGGPSRVFGPVLSRAAGVIAGPGVPAWLTRNGFRLLDPVKSLRSRAEFVAQLHDRERLAARERQRQFVAREGWLAYPGPALNEMLRQVVAENRLASGGFVVGDLLTSLSDISKPIMTVVGTDDRVAPPGGVRGVRRAAPAAEVWEMTVPTGHLGLVVGSYAVGHTWPAVAGWIQWHEGRGPRPEPLVLLEDQPDESGSRSLGISYGVNLIAQLGGAASKNALSAFSAAARTARELSIEALTQLPRLARLEQIQAGTRVSFGSLLDEQAASDPGADCFLFGDRTHSRGDTKHRIDSVVKGLISVGVRQGDAVGVLMPTRPSAFVVIAALNRLGAVSVLLRPGADTALELSLGGARRVVTDPENADGVLRQCDLPVIVLGASDRKAGLPAGAVDLEAVDPAAVTTPRWYRANPGRARDLAFVVFSGEGLATRARRITNHRWALSAFGTASAAALSNRDTVYATTPLHHPSGLLTTIGGAVAGGARLALSREFSADVFWEETRRYGATVVSYTWTMLREVVDAPADRREPHHSIRLFIGSGMPAGLWKRVGRRFRRARVVEFYAPIDGEAVLANVSSHKPGAIGRPLPGSSAIRIGAYDIEAGRFVYGADGLVRECAPGEVGMLLVEVHPAEAVADVPMRGVFRSGDAWRATGDLFWKDRDGDHWLAGPASTVIRAQAGLVFPSLVDDALLALGEVDLAVTYAVTRQGRPPLVVSAVQLRDEAAPPTQEDLTDTFASLARGSPPDAVRVVAAIPLTAWYRPNAGALASEGLDFGGPAWWRNPDGQYEPLTIDAAEKLLGQ